MSILPDEPGAIEGAAARRTDLAIRVVLPSLVAAALSVGLLAGGAGVIDRDLQLAAPPDVRPGDTVALRTLLLGGLRGPEPPEVIPADVRVTLLAEGGAELAQASLSPAAVWGQEGDLAIPDTARGSLLLRAEARSLEGEPVARVVRRLRASPAPRLSERRGRLATGHQRYELGPVEGTAPPSPFDLRVLGGACVPEHRCELSAFAGDPPAALELELPPEIELVSREPAQPGPVAGLVRFAVVVRGPVGLLALVARREGAEVGRREVRLPLSLGGVAVSLARRVVREGEAPTLSVEQLDAPRALLVDGYRDGVWARAASLPADRPEGPFAVPFALQPGLWRLQLRTDASSADRAGAVLVRVLAPDEDADVALAAIDRVELPGDDPLLASLQSAGGDAAVAHRHALAELEVFAVPPPTQGATQQVARVVAAPSALRWAAAALILLCGVAAAVLLARRGLAASSEARRLLVEAGDDEAESPAARRRMTLVVAASSLVLATCFAAAALWVLSRGG